ncbi:hypothetical protein [Methylocaldum gracile]|uniref:hypothetical protein n=1 Tax=unclassified Methylocaldum TaxID=2622260 RepID=UPI00105E7B6D
MERTVHGVAERVPQPQRVPYKDSYVFRYVEKTVHQALVQKLARLVSSLHASRLLMTHGFVQEQAAMQRILDELQEDITFLSLGVIFGKWTSLHDDYLAAFFEEEFDADSAMESTQKRRMIPRKKIRAWIASMEGGLDPSRGVELMRTISKAYSGYVHAASPHIMDMYGGNPPRFHMRGMLGTPRHATHRADLWNYFYRGIIAFGFAAKAFGDDQLFSTIRNFADEFARISGKDYQSAEWDET